MRVCGYHTERAVASQDLLTLSRRLAFETRTCMAAATARVTAKELDARAQIPRLGSLRACAI